MWQTEVTKFLAEKQYIKYDPPFDPMTVLDRSISDFAEPELSLK